jgi:hypothetical protein
MKKLNTLWIPVLLGVLLLATLVGVAGAKPDARPLQQAWRLLALSPSDCVPQSSGISGWWNNGDYIECPAGSPCGFMCPVHFPAAGEQSVGAVHVKRVTLYIRDLVAGDVAVELWKNHAPTGVQAQMAGAKSFGSCLVDPCMLMDTSIVWNPVYRNQGPYLYIGMPSVGHRVSGAYIHYTW